MSIPPLPQSPESHRAGGGSRVVTIDGPAGTGKSSVARALAERLSFDFLDTGAMYRAVASTVLRAAIDPDDAAAVDKVTSSIEYDPQHGGFSIDGVVLSGGDLRTPEVTEAASLVARHAGVRTQLVEWQRQFAEGRRTVTEGRDQGTVVFPDAAVKFFLDAAAEERANRRVRELHGIGRDAEYETVLTQIRDRDLRDRNRVVAPLRPAEDAICIDTTTMTIEGVVSALEDAVRSRLNLSADEN